MRSRMKIRRRSLPRLAAAALMVAVSTACTEDPAGPGQVGEFDAVAVDANLDALDAVFLTGEWKSFEALSSLFNLGNVAASVGSGSSIESLRIDDMALGTGATLMAASRITRVAAGSIPVISTGARGTTFVIDPATGQYVPDAGRSGAPSNGVRFILYGLNPITGEPLLEQEIGHADLVDEGDAVPGIALRLTVVSGGETFLEYAVRADGGDTSGSIEVDGFVRDAEHRLDFELDMVGNSNGGQQTFDLDVHLEITSRGFEVDVSVSGLEVDGSGSGTIEVLVRHGDDSIQVDITGSDTEISAEFRLNGGLFATATGDPENPVIRGAGGEPLTVEEQHVLIHVLEAIEDVFEFFGELLVPAAGIILLGVVL
jgi:hypothetical protein